MQALSLTLLCPCGRPGLAIPRDPFRTKVAQTVTQDGIWCASAQLRPGVGAFGDGPTQEDAMADLRAALKVLIDEVGPPDELTLTLNVA